LTTVLPRIAGLSTVVIKSNLTTTCLIEYS
jgi:hypothetical protein